MLLSLYLQERNITPEKCGLHTLLFLIQPGDQEEKAEALVSALIDFENNAWHRPVLEILPKLSGNYNMTVAELGRQIENFLEEENASRLENSNFHPAPKGNGLQRAKSHGSLRQRKQKTPSSFPAERKNRPRMRHDLSSRHLRRHGGREMDTGRYFLLSLHGKVYESIP